MTARLLRLESHHMGRPIHVWTFGVMGRPLVVFPSNAGVAHEWQKAGMIDAVGPLLAAGRMKVYCVETNVSRSFSGKTSLHERMREHKAYERFVIDELVPFIRDDCRQPHATMTAAGCSVGALYSALFSLKHPELFPRALCLSGRYRASRLVGGTDEDLYYNDPLAFVPNLYGQALDRVQQRAHLTLVVGRGKHESSCIPETAELAAWLRKKRIPNHVDFWGYDSAHDYPWWRKQARHYLSQMF